MSWLDRSLRARLTLLFVGLLAILLIGLAGFVYLDTRDFLIESKAARLRAQAKPLLEAWQADHGNEASAESVAADANDLSRSLTSADTVAVVYDADGRYLDDGKAHPAAQPSEPDPVAPDPGRLAEALGGANEVTWVVEQDGADQLVALVPLRPRPGGEPVIGITQLSSPLADVNGILAEQLLVFGIGIPVTVGLGALGALGLTSRGLTPLQRLIATCRRIAAGDLSQRAKLAWRRDEVGQLGAAFDEMVDRIEASFAVQRRFVADAAHELRTPLTALEGSLEVLRRGSQDNPASAARLVGAMHRDVRRLGRMTEQLLDVARLEARPPLYRTRLSLDPFMATFIEEAQPLARGRELHLDPGPAAVIDADAGALRQLLLNLVDNAAQHTADGGRIVVSWRADNAVRIAVADDGEGIAATDVAHVFEPFYRGDRSRSSRRGGTGLGLAIALGIAQAHGASLEVNSKAGRGAVFTLTIARSSGDAPGHRPVLPVESSPAS